MAKILAVDDDPDMAELVKLVLELGHHTVTLVTEPENAVATALELLPDLILLDVVMPKVDGFDIFREIREQPTLANIPIAFLTSNNKSVDLMVGLHVMRAEDYITKPFGKQDLLNRVNKLLEKNGIK
jgi:two-component system, OmpR family, response regulator VicR